MEEELSILSAPRLSLVVICLGVSLGYLKLQYQHYIGICSRLSENVKNVWLLHED